MIPEKGNADELTEIQGIFDQCLHVKYKMKSSAYDVGCLQIEQKMHLEESRGYHIIECYMTFSCVRLFATSCTVAHQALLSMEFSRQEF